MPADDLAAKLHADLMDQAQDVALGGWCVRPQDEVGRGKDIEVDSMVGIVERGVEQLAQFLARRGQFDVVDRVAGLGRGHMMRLRADAADARRDARHFFHGPAFGELFKPA